MLVAAGSRTEGVQATAKRKETHLIALNFDSSIPFLSPSNLWYISWMNSNSGEYAGSSSQRLDKSPSSSKMSLSVTSPISRVWRKNCSRFTRSWMPRVTATGSQMTLSGTAADMRAGASQRHLFGNAQSGSVELSPPGKFGGRGEQSTPQFSAKNSLGKGQLKACEYSQVCAMKPT